MHLLQRLNPFKRDKHVETQVKRMFRTYFEPTDFENPGERKQYIRPVSSLEITNISVKRGTKHMEMVVTLCRPGLLIGPKGCVINSLTEYIQRRLPCPFKISIKESNLWK